MKASIKLVTTDSETSNGYPIYLKLSHGKKRPKKVIGHTYITDWNSLKSELFNTHPDFIELQPKILETKANCVKINHGSYSFDQAKALLFPDSNYGSSNLLAFFDVRIKEKKSRKQPFQSYKDVKAVFSKYLNEVDIPINDITYEWLNKFVLFKLNDGCAEGGVMSYLRTLRAIYKEAQRRKSLKIKSDNPFIGVIVDPVAKEVIDFSTDDFKLLFSFIPKKSTRKDALPKLERNIKIFFFQFLIGGHDYIDVALLTWSKIKNGRARFKRYKLRNKKRGGELIDNVLLPEALSIIDVYGDKKSERVFSFIPNPITEQKKYKNFVRAILRSLESISDTLEFKRHISTKSTRYIFRTYAGELLIHDLIVMKLQGHKPEGISYRYQGVISKEVQDEAHKKIVDLVLNA